MKLFSTILVGLALLALPLLSACGDDDSTAKTTPTIATQASTTAATAAATTAAATAAPTKAATAAASAATTVGVSEADFSVKPDKTTFAAGKVTFNAKNDGATVHEFVVIKTDLAEDKLPTAGGIVDLNAAGVTKVAATGDIAVGATTPLTIDNLPAGTYVLICNKPAHYVAGMHTTIKVQ